MKPILFLVIILYTHACSAQIDLSRDPSKPIVPVKKSNAQLLKESQQPAEQNTDTNLSQKYKARGLSVSPDGNHYNDNGKLNTQSQQYNIGNGGAKATSTINYDNSGKIQGNTTTIDFGKKKK